MSHFDPSICKLIVVDLLFCLILAFIHSIITKSKKLSSNISLPSSAQIFSIVISHCVAMGIVIACPLHEFYVFGISVFHFFCFCCFVLSHWKKPEILKFFDFGMIAANISLIACGVIEKIQQIWTMPEKPPYSILTIKYSILLRQWLVSHIYLSIGIDTN